MTVQFTITIRNVDEARVLDGRLKDRIEEALEQDANIAREDFAVSDPVVPEHQTVWDDNSNEPQ